MNKNLRQVFYLLFALSGFSGLIYESIWSHYMKLFLGHAAYAQTIVLSIFMAGTAIGSLLCSRYSAGWKNLLGYYALAELIIGVFALIFHDAFDWIVQLSYNVIIPYMKTPAASNAYQWFLSVLLILPQSILIGMPFPLMSAGILRKYPKNPGKSVSMLYFSNSIGASIGVLISGFSLINMLGLPGTIKLAGFINIAIALTVWLMARENTTNSAFGILTDMPVIKEHNSTACYRLFLIASLVTGTASFIYEIGWIRMLSLVMGSSTHAFELMLSAFIFGLACGAMWIRKNLDYLINPVNSLARIQITMGILALATLPLYGKTFEVMKWIMDTLQKTATGYTIFNLSSHAIALTVMLPATFCAGMTLPLITYILIKQGQGEKTIGAVYAANTIGAIIGIFFAVHIGMPMLGLKGLITFGAGLDILLGLVLLWKTTEGLNSNRFSAAITAVCICAVAATIITVKLDPYKMASGIYRNISLLNPEENRIIYHKDGKTATVTLSLHNSGIMSIRTNGKPDAAININPYGEHSQDETTMILSAAVPMALNPAARRVANIGLGSGLTAHTILNNYLIEHVDTVEIEENMVEAAKSFGPRVELVYTDPRSEIHIDDAKTFFSTHAQKYDIIISEPSNPWVSGVATLFSEEFYRLINRHLAEDGLFVQWFQLYEIDLNLVISVLKAVSLNFSDFVIYAPNNSDIIIIAKSSGAIPEMSPHLFEMPGLRGLLKRICVENLQDMEVRRIGDKKILTKLIEQFPIRTNSDYYPVLDLNAARAMFMKANATELLSFSFSALPTVEMLSGKVQTWKHTDITPSPYFAKTEEAKTAMALRDYFLYGSFSPVYGDIHQGIKEQAVQLKHMAMADRTLRDGKRMECLYNIALRITPFLSPFELEAIWEKIEARAPAGLFNTSEEKWFSLFKAVGNRDAVKIAGTAKILLKDSRHLNQGTIRYLVASGMLGSLAMGDKEESFRIWSSYKSRIGQPNFLFHLLNANSSIS